MSSAAVGVHSVYAVVGHDRLLRHEALERILSAFGDALDTLGPVRVDATRTELADVLDEVRTPSLLGDCRVVIVDDADGMISANRAVLERFCSSPCDTGSMILLCQSLPRNTRLYKIIEKSGRVLTCEAPRGRAVAEWIVARGRSVYDKRIGSAAAESLREHVGDAPSALDAELGKLAAFAGTRDEIVPADIDALTGNHREEKVFAVTDAMSGHDPADALRHWEQVLATDAAAPARAIAGLAWGVRRLLEARRDFESGVDLRELARRMYTDPRTLRRRLESVSTEQLEDQQRDLLAADFAVKTGLSTVSAAIEKFIVEHSTAALSSTAR